MQNKYKKKVSYLLLYKNKKEKILNCINKKITNTVFYF